MVRGMPIRRPSLHAATFLFAALAFSAAHAAAPPAPQSPPPSGSTSRGAEIYENKCGACHSLDQNRIGPKHRGVYGRKSASVPDFSYTPALKKLNVVWNAATLDRWLQNPTAMAPGTAMGFRLTSAQDRADVIAYLKQESAKH
jgi:cytochrome c